MERFKSGDKIVVTNGTMVGSIAFIANEYYLPDDQGGIKYSLQPESGYSSGPNPFMDIRFPPEDLILITPRPEPRVEFDVSKYLDEGKMREIAERVYEVEVKAFVDQVLRNRVGSNGTITDQILHACVERYVDKLAPDFEEKFLNKVQEEISREKAPDDNYYPFCQGLAHRLDIVAGKWIDANIITITQEIKPKIQEAINALTADSIAAAIGWKLNSKMKDVLSEVLKEYEKEQEKKNRENPQ